MNCNAQITETSVRFSEAHPENFDANRDSLIETIAFKTYTGGVMAIEAKLNNSTVPLNFILDTGSGGISLDSATCEALNLQLKPTDTVVYGIAGKNKVSFAFDQQLQMGKLTAEHLDFYVNDYSLLSSTYGEKVDGVIGYSLLKRYIYNIDFDSMSIKIYRTGNFKYDRGGRMLHPAFTKLAAYPISVKDNGRSSGDIYLDSGAGLNLLLSEAFVKDSSLLLKRRKPFLTQAEGLGGKKPMRLTVVKVLKFGPFSFRNVPAHLYKDEDNIFAYPYRVGLIGNDLMRRFNMTLNYAQKEIYLVPNSHFNDKFDYAYTGMSLYVQDEKVYIDDIVPDSPAAKAGLKNEDEVISVANNISGNIQEYKNLLQNTDRDVKLIVKRKELLVFISMRAASIR